jgi:hypothetical protein
VYTRIQPVQHDIYSTDHQAYAAGTASISRRCEKKETFMLSDEQVAVLCDIGQSIAFDDSKQGAVDQLVIEGYVAKHGDLYELTPKGEKVIVDRGAGLNEA